MKDREEFEEEVVLHQQAPPVHQPELPYLELNKKKMVGDMETELVSLGCRGNTVQEAMAGIEFLLIVLKEVDKNE